jgi:MFS family permease
VGFGALFGTAACEIYGRPVIYQFTIPISLIFTIVGGTATNFTTIAIARTFAGLASGPCLTVGTGVLNDVWDVSLEKTGTMFAFFYVLTIIWSTQTAPMISAALMTYHTWQWTFWVSVIMIATVLVCSIFLPETYHPQIKRARAQKLGLQVPSRGNSLKIFLTAVGRPLHMILVESIVSPTGLACAVNQSVVFVYYVAYGILFEETYGFTQYQVCMAFGPLLVGGTVLAIPVLALFGKLTYQKAREQAMQHGETVKPENRLYPALLSSITLPVSLFW